MTSNNSELEKRLWKAADELRANSNLTMAQYASPVLGLIFLRYADVRFTKVKKEVDGKETRRRTIGKVDYQEAGAMYLPDTARFSNLITLPEGADTGKAINDAMRTIEEENEDLKDVLPKTYNSLENRVLVELLKIFNSIPMDTEGDAFGKIYEYFLGNFALGEGQRGGQFFTATSIVKLIVEIIEPFRGLVLDPACGSGGMFVQSAEFVRQRKGKDTEISIYGQEQVTDTVRLCRMNLAVNGLHGDVREGNTYYEDIHDSPQKFDFVMANPPFNVNNIDKERIKDDRRHYPFGMPRADNGNYLWIQFFYSALKSDSGRAGFVMANSASDARQSEMEIRKRLIDAGAVDVMVAVGSNFFYNVTLPVTLWFLDNGKRNTPRQDQVLFLDARSIYTQIDRAHREFTPEQIQLLANIVRLYRQEALNGYEFTPAGLGVTEIQAQALKTMFTEGTYADVAGLCKLASRAEIEEQGWSLNPGRYVGVAERDEDDFVFEEKLEALNEELETLNAEAWELEERIAENVARLLEGNFSH